VRALMNNRLPISGFDRPSRASRAITASWAVSPSLVWTVRLRAVSPVARSSRPARSASPARPHAGTARSRGGPELAVDRVPGRARGLGRRALYSSADQALQMARDRGALAALPALLDYRAGLYMHTGRFHDASALIGEADAISEATGGVPFRYVVLALAAWRGEEAAVRHADLQPTQAQRTHCRTPSAPTRPPDRRQTAGRHRRATPRTTAVARKHRPWFALPESSSPALGLQAARQTLPCSSSVPIQPWCGRAPSRICSISPPCLRNHRRCGRAPGAADHVGVPLTRALAGPLGQAVTASARRVGQAASSYRAGRCCQVKRCWRARSRAP
jgi:hypothetical protein